ncbi:MAG: hypothetical protein SOI04_07885 [Bifidobacterium thermacidophilum]|jgi:hypothetical protein|uniref:hypothetical protein n=1 Tax=Bifidobacterium thermacidophilum TaxID=246618 RepID=UPI002F3519DB
MKTLKCGKCGRRFRERAFDAECWNVTLHAGIITQVLCPDCQTPEQDMEAQVNEAMLDYSRNPAGQIIARMKGADDE